MTTFSVVMSLAAFGVSVISLWLSLRTARRGRFVWSIETSGTISTLVYQLRNYGTDDAEDVTLTPLPTSTNPEFRELPTGATIHAHGSHEFYCHPAYADVLPREMRLTWSKGSRLIALPSLPMT